MSQELDLKMECDIVELGLNAPRISKDVIDKLVADLRYETWVVPGTTTTIAVAIDKDNFTYGIGKTLCVDKENFDAALGVKYAIEDAEEKSRDMYWELEGYVLKQRLKGLLNSMG